MKERVKGEMAKGHWGILKRLSAAEKDVQANMAVTADREAKLNQWSMANTKWQADVEKGLETLRAQLGQNLQDAETASGEFNNDLQNEFSVISEADQKKIADAMGNIDGSIESAAGDADAAAQSMVMGALKDMSHGSEAGDAEAANIANGALAHANANQPNMQGLDTSFDALNHRAEQAGS